MKVLITGANGLLGQRLIRILLDKGVQVVASGKKESRIQIEPNPLFRYYAVDITDDAGFHELMFSEEPDVVVHAAAMTQVDECEQDQNQSYAVNVEGTNRVLVNAELFSSLIIYVSTDFVFDGEKGNYLEEDPMNPVNWYGHTKMQAEAIIAKSSIPWAIVRTCLVYGPSPEGTRKNILVWVEDKLRKKEKIQVVDDQWRTPTFVDDLARGIALIIEKRAEGIYHISGKDWLTPYEMAVRTAQFLSLDTCLIERADASSFSQPARRPAKTGFVIEKARVELQFEPISFEAGLAQIFPGNS